MHVADGREQAHAWGRDRMEGMHAANGKEQRHAWGRQKREDMHAAGGCMGQTGEGET